MRHGMGPPGSRRRLIPPVTWAAFASLALDGAGNPHLAYSDYTNMQLKYKYWDGADLADLGDRQR